VSGALFLTGGTGFLGMELVSHMLDAGDGPDIYLAVRARDRAEAEGRIASTIGRLYDTPPESIARVRAVRADLTAPGLGMSDDDRRAVAADVERVIHCAASISFTLPLEEAREINVVGTERVLELAATLPRLERLVHVSTAYVSGRTPQLFDETRIDGSGFRNTYEQTKAEAEAVVAASDVPAVVVRPSIVVGESDSGWTSAFNVLYWPLQAFARGLLPVVPADPDGIVDMVPVDYVAEIIERAAYEPGASGRYHAVAADRAVTVRELVDEVCRDLGREPPQLTPAGSLPDDHPANVFEPYFDIGTRFDNRRARELADGGEAPHPFAYLPRLLAYGEKARWGKRSLTREAARDGAGARSS
jgi:nucleoside-diphosphate-sugar epimerase